jgi:MEMO1 family protein
VLYSDASLSFPGEVSRVREFVPIPWLLLGLAACTERPADRAIRPRQAVTQPSARASSHPTTTNESMPQSEPSGIRRAQKAGTWYPQERAWAIAEMHRMLRQARAAPSVTKKPLALLVPHAGWSYSGVAAAAAFRQLHRGNYARVVLIGPSHGHLFAGFSLPKFDAYETPLGQVPVCPEASALRDNELVRDLPEADRGEHSLELELPWLQESLGSFCLLPILVGTTNADSERALAQKLSKLKQQDTLFVVSGDFVHYGARFAYTPFGASVSAARKRVFELENQAIGFLQQKDPDGYRELIAKTDATICGYRGHLVLLELLRQVAPDAQAVTFAHYSSAELPQEHGQERDESGSVGYVALGYVDKAGAAPSRAASPMGAPATAAPCGADATLDEATGQRLLQLAKSTLLTQLQGTNDLGRALAALPPSPRLDCRQAVFVTLKEAGELRGCVGQVEPEYPLFQAIVRSALDAALNDRRFEPVTAKELSALSFEVTALSVPREVPSYRDIVLGRHGIILAAEGRRALFLPQVPGEQGWDLEATLRALSTKAGLQQDAWREHSARFSVFTGVVFHEPSKVP